MKPIFLLLACLIIGSCKDVSVNEDAENIYQFLEGEMVPNTEEFYAMDEPFSLNFSEFSRDGSKIVYTKFTNRPHRPRFGVFIYDVGSAQENLLVLDGYLASWSPDAEWVAFNIYPQIYKIKSNGDSLTKLTNGAGSFNPRWSPDGKRIGFEGNTRNNVMNSDGSGLGFIGDNGFGAIADWHPSGTKVLGVHRTQQPTRKMGVFNLQTNRTEQIIDLGVRSSGKILYSPDGSRICFNSERGIYVMNADGSNRKRILPTDTSPDRFPDYKGGIKLLVGMPSWHPDGKHLLYAHFRVTRYEIRDGIITGFRIGLEGYYSLYTVNVDSAVAVSTLPN